MDAIALAVPLFCAQPEPGLTPPPAPIPADAEVVEEDCTVTYSWDDGLWRHTFVEVIQDELCPPAEGLNCDPVPEDCGVIGYAISVAISDEEGVLIPSGTLWLAGDPVHPVVRVGSTFCIPGMCDLCEGDFLITRPSGSMETVHHEEAGMGCSGLPPFEHVGASFNPDPIWDTKGPKCVNVFGVEGWALMPNGNGGGKTAFPLIVVAPDINRDDGLTIVNTKDLCSIIFAWETDCLIADLNCDGTVDTEDLVILFQFWGQDVPPFYPQGGHCE